MSQYPSRKFWALLALLPSLTLASESQPKRLPEPLTLQAALAIAGEQHPSVMLAQAAAALASAEKDALAVRENFQMRFEGGLARREFNGKDEEYNNAYLVLQKQLYDFDRTRLGLAAQDAQLAASAALEEQARADYRQRVIAAFYDVLLADLQFRVDNEDMAVQYVDLDHLRDEMKVGKRSELDLFEAEDRYQRTLVRRAESEQARRTSRAALAELLGYADRLPETLELPDVSALNKRQPGEVKAMTNKALENNPQLRAVSQQLAAAELKAQSADQLGMPRIDAIGRTGWHTNPDRYEGRWRYDLMLTVPIVDGGYKAAELDKAKAEVMRVRAQKEAVERQIRLAVLQTAMSLEAVKARRGQVQAAGDYAERYLDKSRTEYQLERKTDLGDSMVRATRAELELLRLNRDTAVLWETLTSLLGEKP